MNPRFIRLAGAAIALAAAFVSGHALSANCTWTGSVNGKWSEPLNWSCPLGPQNGDAVVFPDGASNKSMEHDLPLLTILSVQFPGTGGGYTLTGASTLVIAGGASAIVNRATGANQNTLALGGMLRFGDPLAIIDNATGAGGTLNLNGPIDLNNSVLTFTWDSTVPRVVIGGAIAGTGALQVDGAGADVGLVLSGSNTFNGPVTVTSGYMAVNHASALGVGGGIGNWTRVKSGGTLVLQQDVAGETLMLEGGSGQSGNGNVQANGARTWSGPVQLTGGATSTTTFNLSGSNQITFSGPVSGAGGFVCCNSIDSRIAFSDSANSYAGPASLAFNSGGTLLMLASNVLSPNAAIVLGGSTGGVLDMGMFSGQAASFAGSSGSKLRILAGQALTVSGAVALDGTTLEATLTGLHPIGAVFRIIDKTGAGAVTGTFAGVAEGGTIFASGVPMKVSYVGGDGNDVTLTITGGAGANVDLSVTLAGSGTGKVQSAPAGIDCGAACTASFAPGTPITLTATPDAGKQFTGWLGACTGTGNCQITLNENRSVSATFSSTAIGPNVLDVDGNGGNTPLTDGLLVIRYLFGLNGAALINNAVAVPAARSSAPEVQGYLLDIKPRLDVDGNGQSDPLTDGLMIIRYLFAVRGSGLIANAIGPGATRTTIVAIEGYIASLLP